MLEKIRKFSKTIFAKILLVIVVIPFVFWGMGGVFNSGNTNSIAKINNTNVSTQEFIEFLNNSKISQNVIAANINNNILEELLRQFISIKILELEIQELDIIVSDKSLANEIKKDQNFLDDNNNFSRVNYEKFLLVNNITASNYEKGVKERILQQRLFAYIGAGVISPNFLTNSKYISDTKKIDVKFINLINVYKSKNSFTEQDIKKYIKENSNELKREYIDISYSKIMPFNLTGKEEYDNDFFDKIDEIENKISNNENFKNITDQYNLKIITKKNFFADNKSDLTERKIYNMRNQTKLGLSDENDFFLLFNIENVSSNIPGLDDQNFIDEVKLKLFNNEKYQYNQNLISKINNKTFDDNEFRKIVNNDNSKIEDLTLETINDNKLFDEDSVRIIYSMPINSFVLLSGNDENIYIAKIISEETSNIPNNTEILNTYNQKSASDIKRDILLTYDLILNSKYEIRINEKTLDRVKNYF